MKCDACHVRDADRWYEIDGHIEAELCDDCAEEFKASNEMTIEPMEGGEQ